MPPDGGEQVCVGCGLVVRVVRRMWLGQQVTTTSNADRFPLGYPTCNRCWWWRRLKEIDAA
jgi:hypothetical protein